jgi:hypothetical protein
VTSMTMTLVGTSRGNVFMNELLAAIAHEVRRCGAEADLVLDRFPDAERSAYVVVPHEYFETVPARDHPSEEQLRRTISLSVEQPGTGWFDLACVHAGRSAAVVDIRRTGVRELRRRGLMAEHFQLGYTEYWDKWRGDESLERPIDLLHLGTETPRRLRALAAYARTLWRHETRVLLPPVAPKPGPRPDFLVGEAKWHALRSAKALLNIHRDTPPYFEWVRALEAIANGCVVISEHSQDVGPLVAGQHFISGRIENLGLLADRLLRDEERLNALRSAAYDFIRTELPMQPAAQRLIGIAETVTRHVPGARRPESQADASRASFTSPRPTMRRG